MAELKAKASAAGSAVKTAKESGDKAQVEAALAALNASKAEVAAAEVRHLFILFIFVAFS